MAHKNELRIEGVIATELEMVTYGPEDKFKCEFLLLSDGTHYPMVAYGNAAKFLTDNFAQGDEVSIVGRAHSYFNKRLECWFNSRNVAFNTKALGAKVVPTGPIAPADDCPF